MDVDIDHCAGKVATHHDTRRGLAPRATPAWSDSARSPILLPVSSQHGYPIRVSEKDAGTLRVRIFKARANQKFDSIQAILFSSSNRSCVSITNLVSLRRYQYEEEPYADPTSK
ncbi:hypothetical protein ANO14919_090020 [Xylariales sp. No.14919]|nr:hypothetical protein ANO14919_090020 [Xylariales sp. No.14919]